MQQIVINNNLKKHIHEVSENSVYKEMSLKNKTHNLNE